MYLSRGEENEKNKSYSTFYGTASWSNVIFRMQ
jgi:hypothetical protein